MKKTAEETEMEEERLRIELENELKKEEVGIPVWIRADKQTPPAFMEYSEFLPTYEEILDALGLGRGLKMEIMFFDFSYGIK